MALTKKIDPAACLIFLFSFILSFSLISKGPYNVDCLSFALQAQKILHTGQIHYFAGYMYPFTLLLCALFITVFKALGIADIILALNFMSIIFSALAVLMLYLVVKKISSPFTAALAAVSFALNPIFLSVSVYGSSHPVTLFFLLFSIYALLRYKENGGTGWFLFFALSFGLVGGARFQDMIFMMIPVAYLYFTVLPPAREGEPRFSILPNKIVWNVVVFLLIVMAINTIFYSPLFNGAQANFIEQQVAVYKNITIHDNSLWQKLAAGGGRCLYYLIQSQSIVGLLISLAGFVFIWRQDRRIFLFILLWLIIPLAFLSHLSITVPRYMTLVLPPLIFAQSVLLTRLFNFGRVFKYAVVIAYLIIAFVTLGPVYPLLKIRHDSAYLPDYARWVAAHTEANAKIIVGDDSSFFVFYGPRNCLSKPLKSYLLTDEELLDFKSRLDAELSRGVPIYVTFVGLYDYDPQKKFSTFLKENYNLEFIGRALYEDWHRGELSKRIFYNPLLKVSSRTTLPGHP